MTHKLLDIGIIIGSLRKESYNRQLANFIIREFSQLANFEIIEIRDFPLFNEDLETNVPEAVLTARQIVTNKDAMIFITAEYNHSIPGVMKNALDWFSRGDLVMMKKPYLLMGATTGIMGTTRAQAHIRQVLDSGTFQMYSLPNNELLFARVQEKLDDEGNIINDFSLNLLTSKIKQLIEFTMVKIERL